ncbi:MAG: RsmD family RNA methyltransferase [Planctomycetes bacterium]|nr:RsmD family RNA methyltransferase [Planctomycetota bacterium]
MRIIAGEFGGRRIEAPDTQGTRPMLDRVRESVFATLGNAVEGARVLDLYAGSGSLGLEALSRGAVHVRFVEQAKVALDALKANVEELGVKERVRVIRGNALARTSWHDELAGELDPAFARGKATRGPAPTKASPSADGADPIASSGAAAQLARFDLVLFDPPYRLLDDPNDRAKLLKVVDEVIEDHLNDGGVFVFHAPGRALNTLRLSSGRTGDLRTYGTSAILYLWKRASSPAPRTGKDAE